MKARNTGLDLARAVAVFVMIFVNYKVAMEVEFGHPLMLSLSALFEGRAAALFVILAGIGITVATNKARIAKEGRSLKQARIRLVKRGMALIVLGLMFSLVWPADILHFYGAYFMLSALCFTLTNRQLASIGVFCIVLFPVLLMMFNYDEGWDWSSLTYVNFWSFDGFLKQLFFNGFHPVFPWFSFLLLGMYLGRLDLFDKTLRKKILLISLSLFIAVEVGFFMLREQLMGAGEYLTELEIQELLLLLSREMIPPMPQYIISSSASALIVLMACLQLADSGRNSIVVEWIAKTGRLALSLYIGHIVVGLGLLDILGLFDKQSLTVVFFSTLLFIDFSILFSVVWLKRFDTGPLEWLFRKVTS
ncbi:DUF418 domain-containing protein [Vibrio genomosp. F10 str. 9ZC157]|uniref:DUF418 domain-containing protein n=1 Tax=Vibrio genomosp. F10 TaxID=723171 RepID=UPI0002E5BC8D|nr:DUF418 domain-containing protein [Vibrio genomosp. F10]OEE93789.1 hypothetical protein A1QM_01395 [Vibrio genomosp. F10 str. 9ZC157]